MRPPFFVPRAMAARVQSPVFLDLLPLRAFKALFLGK